MLKSLGHTSQPKETVANLEAGFWQFSFTHEPEYNDHKSLTLQCLIEKGEDNILICLFSEDQFHVDRDHQDLSSLTSALNLPLLNISEPWPLEIVRVEKPWGAEIWYTGIEQRGVCTANGIPLPWLLDCLPKQSIGSAVEQNPLLLKILDPLPDPALGDLYFELHDQKIEVYIVTHVDNEVWSDGIGKIRFGFNQELRSTFESDEAFKASYLDAVRTYQKSRQEIDVLIDQAKQKDNISLDAPASPEQAKQWLAEIPEDLKDREQRLKAEMERYTHLRDIRVGDVIKVEPFFPHSLQHGVRVIEFQTASYERYILSFGQKVLTQSYWDTEEALGKAILSMPSEEVFIDEPAPAGISLEVIADFSAFTAKRLRLEAGTTFQLQSSGDYSLIISAGGDATLADNALDPESARLIPANTNPVLASSEGCVCIIAEPKS